MRWIGRGEHLWSVRIDVLAPDQDAARVGPAHRALLALLEEWDGSDGHPQSGIDQGIGHEGRPVVGFTFCVRADDVGDAATLGLATALRASSSIGLGPEFYDVVVVPHSAVVVPLEELDIPMPD